MRQHPAPGHDPLETMTQESYKHPIAPPPELVQQWDREYREQEKVGCIGFASSLIGYIAARAAQWGADHEMEACCEWLEAYDYDEVGRQLAEVMHAARRPKPPSLKEQALLGLSRIESSGEYLSDGMKDLATIRRALEQLDD